MTEKTVLDTVKTKEANCRRPAMEQHKKTFEKDEDTQGEGGEKLKGGTGLQKRRKGSKKKRQSG